MQSDDRPQPILDAAMQRDRLLLMQFDDATVQRLIREWDDDPPLVRTGNPPYHRDYDGGSPWHVRSYLCGIVTGACIVGIAWLIGGAT